MVHKVRDPVHIRSTIAVNVMMAAIMHGHAGLLQILYNVLKLAAYCPQ